MSLSFARDSRLDDRLTRYLVGALPDGEADQLDELSVVDDAFADRLRVAETDLVDGYVRGTLTGELRERFESHYLASPARRAKVAFAKRFLRAVDAANGVAAGDVAPPAATRPRRPALNRLVTWALAAAAVLAIATATLLVRSARLSRDLQSTVAQAAEANRRAAAVNEELTQQRGAADAARRALDGTHATPADSGFALVLLPETRGTGPVPLVALQRDASVLALDLRVDTPVSRTYAVALKDPASNRIVWRGRTAAGSESRSPALVSVRVPAHFLKAQHYALDLFDARDGVAGAFVASYAFEVVRR